MAARPHERMRGLLGRKSLAEDEGILLRHAGSIHTFFMRFAIDAVFLDADDVVIGIAPGSPVADCRRRGAKAVVELASGACVRRGISPGDKLVLA